MTDLTIYRFNEFFRSLHGHDSYPWQARLAERAVNGDWPGAIDLPTGSGKTACIDIAVFALACQASLPTEQRTAPRRIFFCVNRRVIVDEAYNRAKRIAETIRKAEKNGNGVLGDVAAALRRIAGSQSDGDTPPLDALELRGGIYRDNRWARSVTQPTMVCTTIDQLGSRLLFRGYGVSSNAAPIQAALIAYDSLILLDEAHISEPFRQTLDHVARYLDPDKWAEQQLGIKPAIVVPMTATPNDEMRKRGVIELDNKDRSNKGLCRRLTASKNAKLLPPIDDKKLVEAAVNAAVELAEDNPAAVGIMVNRVATAKAIYEVLRKKPREPDENHEESNKKRKKKDEQKHKIAAKAVIELVIGSMRPIDRDDQADRRKPPTNGMSADRPGLRALVGPERPPISEKTSFVVATQCLEIGADYDFDVLVTECASLDALRQRFGRLNRAGRPIDAKAVVLIDKKAVKTEDEIRKVEKAKEANKRSLDPIYGNAVTRTWNWLHEHATEETIDGESIKIIDFGIDAFDGRLREHGDNGRIPADLLAPSASLNAPVMLPAYVDLWCQTAPRPIPDPDVGLFLHGSQRGEPDVQVCWRADLVEVEHMRRDAWCDVVALLPPTSAECMSVPIGRLRAWLKQANATEREKELKKRDDNDLYDIPDEGDDHAGRFRVDGVVWRGMKKSKRLTELTKDEDLRPGDTIVLPVSAGGWRELGHIPGLEQVSTGSGEQPANNESASQTPDPADHRPTSGTDASRIDVAEDAFQKARDRAALRVHPSLRKRLPEGDAINELFNRAADKENPPNKSEWLDLLKSAAESLSDQHAYLRKTLENLTSASYGLWYDRYKDERGFVLKTRQRIGTASVWFLPSLDEGEDELSRTGRQQPVLLSDHTHHVVDSLSKSLRQLPLKSLSDTLTRAAELHDVGKSDVRFQAMLYRTDRTYACLLAEATSALRAKSDRNPLTRSEYKDACRRAGLPDGFRHEMLSVQLAQYSGFLPDDPIQRDLVLHLIAAHHGHARPFAPVVHDNDSDDPPPDMEVESVKGESLSLTTAERLATPPHRLDSGIAERFWSLTRRFGWWGLAYLEAVLRLADQQASAAEDAGEYENAEATQFEGTVV